MSTTTAVLIDAPGTRQPSAFSSWLRSVTSQAASAPAKDARDETDGDDLLRRLREAGL